MWRYNNMKIETKHLVKYIAIVLDKDTSKQSMCKSILEKVISWTKIFTSYKQFSRF